MRYMIRYCFWLRCFVTLVSSIRKNKFLLLLLSLLLFVCLSAEIHIRL